MQLIGCNDDEHYDTASTFTKSMRGSDAEASVCYLAKMLYAGEDIRFIAGRIVIFASENIGNADPRALPLAVSAMQAVDMVGMPGARIILAKSNAFYGAVNAAPEDVKEQRIQPVPLHLRAPHSGAGTGRCGHEYRYPHDYGGFLMQEYPGVSKEYLQPDGKWIRSEN